MGSLCPRCELPGLSGGYPPHDKRMQKAESAGFRRCLLGPRRGDKGRFFIGFMDQENRDGGTRPGP